MTAISHRATSPSRRDQALRRLRIVNRSLAIASIVLTIVLAELAARAFSGHPRPALRSEITIRRMRTPVHRAGAPLHPSITRSPGRLRAPAHAPTVPTSTPSPAPVVSGGS
ncbi:MAG: hypothetical protein JO372_25780 [Solirubrobacterales bacterium]|nr:hypothetical protein [Solirubrobacterales bacterium]